MSALPKRTRLSDEEYLEFERNATEKHELWDGEIVAFAGASPEHGLIISATVVSLYTQLRGTSCNTISNDLRVRLQSGRYVYPDIVIYCDEPESYDDGLDVLTNPTMVVEVLSTSTETHDRAGKLKAYQGMESLKAVILIGQKVPLVEVFSRADDGSTWTYQLATDLTESVDLPSIGCTLALADVYERVTFDDAEPD